MSILLLFLSNLSFYAFRLRIITLLIDLQDAPMRFFYCVRSNSEKDKDVKFLPNFINADKQITDMETDSDNNTNSDNNIMDHETTTNDSSQFSTVAKTQMPAMYKCSSSSEIESDTESGRHTDSLNGSEIAESKPTSCTNSIKHEYPPIRLPNESKETTSQQKVEGIRRIPDLLQIIKSEKITISESKTEMQTERNERKFDMERFDNLVFRPKVVDVNSAGKMDNVKIIKTEENKNSGSQSNNAHDTRREATARDTDLKADGDSNLSIQRYNKNEFLNSFNLTPKTTGTHDELRKPHEVKKTMGSPPKKSIVDLMKIPVDQITAKPVAVPMVSAVKTMEPPFRTPKEKQSEKPLEKASENSSRVSADRKSLEKPTETSNQKPVKLQQIDKTASIRPTSDSTYLKDLQKSLETLKKSMQLEALSNHVLDTSAYAANILKSSVSNNKKLLWPSAATSSPIDLNVERKEAKNHLKINSNKTPYSMISNPGTSSKQIKTHSSKTRESFGESSKSTSESSKLYYNDQKSRADVMPKKLPVPLKPKPPPPPILPCGNLKNSRNDNMKIMNMNISRSERTSSAMQPPPISMNADFSKFYFDPNNVSIFNNKPQPYTPLPLFDPAANCLPKSLQKNNHELIDSVSRKNSLGVKRKHLNEANETPAKEQKAQNLLNSCNIMFPPSLSVTMTNKNIDPSILFASRMQNSVNNYIEIVKLPEHPDDPRPPETYTKTSLAGLMAPPNAFQPSTSSAKPNTFMPTDYSKRQLPCTESFQTKFLQSIWENSRFKDSKEKKLNNLRRSNETITKAHNVPPFVDAGTTTSKNKLLYKGDLNDFFNLKGKFHLNI